jgi:hypothetical protein
LRVLVAAAWYAGLAACMPRSAVPTPPAAPAPVPPAPPAPAAPAEGELPVAGTGWPGFVAHALAVRPDGRTVVACWQECRVLDLETGRVVIEAWSSLDDPRHVAVAADGAVLVAAGRDGLRLLRLDPELRDRLEVALEAPADDLASVAGGWWVRVGDRVRAFGPELAPRPDPLEGSVRALAAAGPHVAVLGTDALGLYGLDGALRRSVPLPPGAPEHVALDPSGRVALTTADGALHLLAPDAAAWTRGPDTRGPVVWVPQTPWLARTGAEDVELVDPHGGPIVSTRLPGAPLAAGTGGVVLVSAMFRDGWSHVVPVRAAELLAGHLPLGTQVEALAFSADGRTVTAGTSHGLVATLDASTGAWRGGRRLEARAEDRRVLGLLQVDDALWVAQPSRLTRLRGEQDSPHALPVRSGVAPAAREGEVVVGGGWIAATALYDLATGAERGSLIDMFPAWRSLHGPDHELFAPGRVYRPALGAPDGDVAELDLATGQVAFARVGSDYAPDLAGGAGAVVAVSPDQIVTFRTPGLAEAGRCPLSPRGRRTAMAVSADGARAAYSEGPDVFLLAMQGCAVRLLSAPDPVSALAFSPDGASLAAGTQGGAVWIWR